MTSFAHRSFRHALHVRTPCDQPNGLPNTTVGSDVNGATAASTSARVGVTGTGLPMQLTKSPPSHCLNFMLTLVLLMG